MATKGKKTEAIEWDRFGSDDRATDAKSRGLSISSPQKKPVRPTTKPKKK